MSIYIAHRRKKTPNALNVPSTDQKETSSVYDEISQFVCPAHTNCFGTSSMSFVQRQRRCDGRTSELFDMVLKNLDFFRFFLNLKNLKSPNLGFLGFL